MDDLALFTASPTELPLIQHEIELYKKASGAQVNVEKKNSLTPQGDTEYAAYYRKEAGLKFCALSGIGTFTLWLIHVSNGVSEKKNILSTKRQ